MTQPAVSVTGLVKRYGDFEAVRGIDLTIESGETFGFLGPNGAGKSTTISMLCTLVTPCGRPRRGRRLRRRPPARRRAAQYRAGLPGHHAGRLPERRAKPATARRAVRHAAGRRWTTDCSRCWTWWGSGTARSSKVATFSGGMKRRLEIARGLMHSPRVLFLDEPTVGLDPQTRSSIWSYIRELKQAEDITIFLTTHYMDEAEYCDRIAIMDHGQIIALDTPEALKASIGKDRVQIHTDDDAAAIAALDAQFGLTATVAEGMVTFAVEAGEEFVPRLFGEFPLPIRSVQRGPPDPGRRLHVLHRQHDPRRRGHRRPARPRPMQMFRGARR